LLKEKGAKVRGGIPNYKDSLTQIGKPLLGKGSLSHLPLLKEKRAEVRGGIPNYN
jgi:hypothetical protein